MEVSSRWCLCVRSWGFLRSGFYTFAVACPMPMHNTSADEVLTTLIKIGEMDPCNLGVFRIGADLGLAARWKRVWRFTNPLVCKDAIPRRGNGPPRPVASGRRAGLERRRRQACGAEPKVVPGHHLRQDLQGWTCTYRDQPGLSRLVDSALDGHTRTGLVTTRDRTLAHCCPAIGTWIDFSLRLRRQHISADFAHTAREKNIAKSIGRAGVRYNNVVSELSFATYEKNLFTRSPGQTRPNSAPTRITGPRIITPQPGAIPSCNI